MEWGLRPGLGPAGPGVLSGEEEGSWGVLGLLSTLPFSYPLLHAAFSSAFWYFPYLLSVSIFVLSPCALRTRTQCYSLGHTQASQATWHRRNARHVLSEKAVLTLNASFYP